MAEQRIGERCKGRWKSILTQCGVDAKYLDANHHPCPCSGQGEDRFRFSNKNGRGNFFCACNDGKSDGFKLLECLHGIDFAGAAKMVEEVLGHTSEDEEGHKRSKEAALHDLRTVQRGMGGNRDHVLRYLGGRGLAGVAPAVLQQVRTHYGLYKIGIKEDQDAMVAKFVTPDGSPSTLHLTYLQDGKKATFERQRIVMTPAAPMAGGAVRLHPMGRDGELGVAEGIETALSAGVLFNLPVWATLNAAMLEAFQPPQGCTLLHIYADNDENFTGQAAAYALAKRCALKWQVPCRVHIPLRPGDYNDVLVRGA